MAGLLESFEFSVEALHNTPTRIALNSTRQPAELETGNVKL